MTVVQAPLVIVGSGRGGYGVLRALRRIDAAREVVLITADDGAAYSKGQLAAGMGGRKEAGELILATAAQMAHRFGATILAHTRVVAIDRPRQAVVTERGERPYGRLVLALGAEARRPATLRGSAAEQVLTVASLADYRYFRHELAGRRRIAILGGGVTGCEFADNLSRAGCAVTLFEPGRQLLGDRLPALCASRLAERLVAAGVRVSLEDGIQRVDQDGDALELTTLSGARRGADLVVAVLGSRPRTAIARAAGLATAHGICVDADLRTSDPEIFALGECAEFAGRVFAQADEIDAACRVIAQVLGGLRARMRWRPWMRRLQIEACPVVLCEPPPVGGEWHETATRRGVTALFQDVHGELAGFVLVGDSVGQAERLFGRLAR
ncbi:MAG TPA: FAD-dependent oxidoreductase [Rhodocyclaceae bacterium]|nr:FAD-dependent oxidoreductase [Rhodocyclaceae bacterium]